MTTAKPKHMAGQTDSADDLIAELARLMAEDAQVDKPKSQPAPVRIPGGDAPAAMSPRPTVESAPRPIRIPGDVPAVSSDNARPSMESAARPQPVEPKSEASGRVEPPAFATNFGLAKPASAPAPAVEHRVAPEPTFTPAAPVAVAAQEVAPPAPSARQPEPAPVEPTIMPALDQDSLADLIAAELAVSPEPEQEPDYNAVDAEPVEELDVTSEMTTGESFPREVDSFGIPPVFGLGSGTTTKTEVHQEPAATVTPEIKLSSADRSHEHFVPPPAHKAEPRPDPLEEIERLIGPAARVQAPATPSPALRSLATPTLPREPEKSAADTAIQNTMVSSIEEAILAAAATSGARVEWVEPAISARLPDEETEIVRKAPRGRVLGMTRSLAGPVVATLLLAVAAVGLYTVLGLGTSTPDGPAPLVAADTTPTKEVPQQPETDASQSVVFNEIAGGNTGADEQIVSRDQSDVDAVTQVAATDANEEGLVNRKVRTVTVRPDGTIVSGGDSLAGSSMLPVDRPSVPDVPGADFSTPELIANAPATTSTTSLPEPTASTTPTVTPVVPGSTVPVVDLTGAPVAGKTAPVPMVRPSSFAPQAAATTAPTSSTPQATNLTALPASTLPATETDAAQPQTAVVTPTGSTAPAYVQLSSQRSEEAARQSAQSIASRFGSLFGGASLEVQRVDLGERGIFYRVRVPADSIQSANTICSSVKANGGDCYTL